MAAEPPFLTQTAEGVFGLAEVVEDFEPRDLERLRAVAQAIRTPDAPGLRAAIALAGSAAQSRFQPFPGDCDFFERVHISAPDREAALDVLVDVIVHTVGRVFPHPRLQFTELLLGSLRWTLRDVDARAIEVPERGTVGLREAAREPGFVKLDWAHAGDRSDRVVAVTKVIDATWEAPDGRIEALDGVLDSFYQEVYLDPASRAHVERLIDQVKPEGLHEYLSQLEGEIVRYSDPGHENYGKVAKRLYNVFRLTGRARAAARLRELFDDPPARLYQVSGALHALEPVLNARRLPPEAVAAQLSAVQDTLKACYEGADRDALVGRVGALPTLPSPERARALEEISERANSQVSRYFGARLREDPEVAEYLDALAAR